MLCLRKISNVPLVTSIRKVAYLKRVVFVHLESLRATSLSK